MPTKYKAILKEEKKLFKNYYNDIQDPNLTNHENIQRTIDALSKKLNSYSNTEFRDQSALASVGLKAIIDDMNGALTHYFIKDEALIEFLKNTEVKDTSIVKEYIEEKANPLSFLRKETYYTIAIHTEHQGIVFTYLQNGEKTVIVVMNDSYTCHFVLGATKLNDICKMAINFIYYLKAYPEKILDGVPQDMVKNDKKNFSKSKCHSIGIADEIIEKTEIINGHIVSPHFRSGFFRHYTDDRYVNMKGKVQFIAATMVKGKAKTVVA